MRHPAPIVKKHVLLILVLFVFSIPFLHAEDFFFNSAGVKIHYIVEGKGEPVLLIHGFGVNIQANWSGIIKELSNTFQVIALDNRGHGQSDKPHNPGAYGRQMMEDSIRLLDHLKIRKAHVVGYSMGGRIAAAIVGYHPERLRTAVLGGFGWNPPGDKSRAAFQQVLAESLEQGKGIGPLIMRLNPVGSPPPTPEQIATVNKMFLSLGNDPLALAAVMRNSVPSPTEAQLRANKVPVLALIGELDPNKRDVDRLNGLMGNLKIVVIPKANHMTAFGDPAFIKNLEDFLIEHSSTTSEKEVKK